MKTATTQPAAQTITTVCQFEGGSRHGETVEMTFPESGRYCIPDIVRPPASPHASPDALEFSIHYYAAFVDLDHAGKTVVFKRCQ